MSEEKNKRYIYLLAGYGGLLFLGVAILRNLLFFQDTQGYVLTTFGYIFLVSYVKFADDKIGATKREKILFRTGLMFILGVVALYYYQQH
ncbi:hypothetical protein [Bacillus sp. CHD6a]|uniref:hypothetical protein n=1 Tax=Bacillus sp. CHD6a TaxID=1643452 RepID=UPI0006CC1F4F|nr:hypothetical protein [Bacillus sp. CHD6a]KPB06023.1 hypothetical protein AAV98_03635 [Bacillus sp. CHD6a]